MSGKLKAIGINSDTALTRFAGLQSKAVQVNAALTGMGRSVATLSDKLSLMRAERDLIPEKNIRDIKRYNTEIRKLERDITKLQTTNNGSKLKSLMGDALSAIPGGGLLANPLVAVTAGVAAATTSSLKFDEGMAKINTTAQLSADKLAGLRSQIIEVGKAQKADPGTLTTTFEKILSQVGDVDVSMKIFKSTLAGAKGGFTDAAIVADALAQSVSAIGAKNADASQVLDVLFAAKRVGAGEFADYARYVPGLISDARTLGISFKDTAGVFAFMTAKGNTAERSVMLMQNAFTALSKSDIQQGLGDAGVQVFDAKGNIRAIDAIFGDLSVKMQSLGSDAARSNFLEKIGLKDAQAKSAFSTLTSEVDKLSVALKATNNATGETASALELASNPLQRVTGLWNSMKYAALDSGSGFVAVLEPLLMLGDLLMKVIGPALGAVGSSITWAVNGLREGNPIVVGFTVAVTGWAIATHGLAAAQWIAATATAGWTAAIGLLNAVFIASPIGWVALAIGGLVAAVMWAWNRFEGFRNVVIGVGTAIKDGVLWIVEKTIGQVKMLAKVLWSLVTLDFAGAQAAVKEGMGFGDKPLKVAVGGPITPAAPVAPAGQGVFANAMPNLQTGEAAPAASTGIGAPKPPTGGPTSPSTPTAKTTADGIATGGSKTQNFNITISKLVGIESFENTGADLDTDTIQDKVLDAIMRALNMSQSLAQ